MDLFEGFVGIHLWDQQPVNDTVFILWLSLLVGFATVFQTNQIQFIKMLKDAVFVKERLSLFENTSGSSFFFQSFMTLQSLLLCCIGEFAFMRSEGYIKLPNATSTLFIISISFILLALFYIFKQVIHELLGYVFAEPEKFKFWKTNYHAIMGVWGLTLYIPVSWMIFTNLHFRSATVLFVFLYILCRFVIIYKTIRIFHIKNAGLLYISLYLCAQEILPLVFLYKGIYYLYNFIEASVIWH